MYGYALYRETKTDVRTAADWRAYVAGGRNKHTRPLANNTKVLLLDDTDPTGNRLDVAIKLHNTLIVLVHADGSFTLNSGGWYTQTTKERITHYTPARVWQQKGIWYINDAAGNTSLFYDGMRVDADGNPLKPRDPVSYEQKLALIKKRVKQYAQGFVKELHAGRVPYPSGGDCWYCVLKTTGGEPLGDASSNAEHIRDHIKSRYYVPALLVNAARAQGYNDMQISLLGMGGHKPFIGDRDIQRLIYKYCVRRLQAEL